MRFAEPLFPRLLLESDPEKPRYRRVRPYPLPLENGSILKAHPNSAGRKQSEKLLKLFRWVCQQT